ncbi:MAG: amidohydrolase family protein [Planctomycetes bacterium]|nr:amidohydrolase family protein [Planctomycetota bacterium]
MHAAIHSLIRNGELYDGTGSAPFRGDLRIANGMITEIGPRLASKGEPVIDADERIVAPGLIDLHVHVFSGVGLYSIEPFEAGLRTGVTTMLDTGTAGALTYPNFERFVIRQAAEEIHALLNISMIGCIQGHPDFPPYMGDLNDGRHADVPSAVACIRQYPERIVGTKVRLTSGLANGEEKNERAGFEGVLGAAEETERPCMVHHIASRIPIETVLRSLRAGDTYTHLYHPREDHGFDQRGAPLDAMWEARERGVLFDVGHGVGAFAWRVAEPACQQFGFWPDSISTDLHRFNLHGPVYDMPTTMSKFLYLGMPLEKVIRASTSVPATAMRLQERLGTLRTGYQADVVLLKREKGNFPLLDVEGQIRHATERLIPTMVCKRGIWSQCAGTP